MSKPIYKRYLEADEEVNPRMVRRLVNTQHEEQIPDIQNMREENISSENYVSVDSQNNDQMRLVQNLMDESIFQTMRLESDESSNDAEDIDDFISSQKNPKNIQDFIKSKNFFDKITTPVDKSRGELFFMILNYSLANTLSLTALTNLFKLVNSIFVEPVLPNTRYLIDKVLNSEDEAQFHSVCPNCSTYVGKFGNLNHVNTCSVCSTQLELSNPSNSSFLVVMDPSTQISDILHSYENHYHYVINERVHKQGHIEDIYDGKAYRQFVNDLAENDRHNYVSLTFNTDGAPKFKCSQYSIWPIYLMINEIPAQDRKNKLITCGLWFNKKKPDMTVFLDPFVEIMNKLSEDGIKCIIKENEQHIKPFVLVCCFDSSARAPIQGVKQYNGREACSWCIHPGLYAEGSIRYNILQDPPALRDEQRTLQDMLRATPENPILGIKHPSPLINLPGFNIIKGFVPDYMHCCLEGVAKQVTEYFVTQLNENELEIFDTKMQSLAVPHQISRLTRSLSIRKDWKAREWENFVLYYSGPLFSSYLNEKMIKYWLLFSESLHILLQENIYITELNRADKMLNEFVVKTEELFGVGAMTYNVHQLLHICQSVLNWGPLWTQSTFPFESANYQLLRAIKCAKGVPQQILRFVHINHSKLILEECVYQQVSTAVKTYCMDTLTVNLKHFTKISDITYLGKGEYIDDDEIATLQLRFSSPKYFKRMIKNGCLYIASSIRNKRSDDSFAKLKDGTIIKIIKFIVDYEDDQEQITLCNRIYTQPYFRNCSKNICKVQFVQQQIVKISTEDICTICVHLAIDNVDFICPVPNLLHY